MAGGRIIKQLLAKNGPMTTNALAEFIPQYKESLVSKSHMKKHILGTLELQGVLFKQVHRGESGNEKPTWLWTFKDESEIEKHKKATDSNSQ